jgi:hypothetical protein
LHSHPAVVNIIIIIIVIIIIEYRPTQYRTISLYINEESISLCRS